MSQEREQLAAFVKRWAVAGPMLEEVARQELREMTDEERRHAIDSLLQVSQMFPVAESTPETCGLVEQQRLFGMLPR